jgi:hypothetical protein
VLNECLEILATSDIIVVLQEGVAMKTYDENKDDQIEIETISLDPATFEELGLSTIPGYSRERILACLNACKRFSSEALELGLVEDSVSKVYILSKGPINFANGPSTYRGIPLYRENEPSIELKTTFR